MKSEAIVMKVIDKSGKFDDGNAWRNITLQLSEKAGADRFDGEYAVTLEREQVELIVNPMVFEGQPVSVCLLGTKVWKDKVQYQGRLLSPIPPQARQAVQQPPLAAANR